MDFALCIPTLNAGPFVGALLRSVEKQTTKPARVLVVDSGSGDQTVDEFRKFGAEVITIRKTDFDHGGTRNIAVRRVSGSQIAVFVTQDAIPVGDTAFASLLRVFDDSTVAAAYGRQLPREGAGIAEAHPRLFNYPEESLVKSLSDARQLGIKTPFLSNSFAAYRVSALREVGGFPSKTLFGEDMYVGAKLLLAGYRIAYVADAQVWHSHSYTLSAEFRRYFDIGAFHAQNPWIMENFGTADREGFKYLRSELRYALSKAPMNIPALLLRNALKLIGMQIGKRESALPVGLKRHLSMNPRFWDGDPA